MTRSLAILVLLASAPIVGCGDDTTNPSILDASVSRDSSGDAGGGEASKDAAGDGAITQDAPTATADSAADAPMTTADSSADALITAADVASDAPEDAGSDAPAE